MANHGFVKVAAASPRMRLGDPAFNAAEMIALWRLADQQGALAVTFPELSITGATCGDLFMQHRFRQRALAALGEMLDESKSLRCAALVGLPLYVMGRLYNVAVLVAQGGLLCCAPRFPDAAQSRWFSRYDGVQRSIDCLGVQMPFGQAIAPMPGAVLGIAFDADGLLSLPRGGANLLLMPAAQRAEAGAFDRMMDTYAAAAGFGRCAIATAFAGPGESSGSGAYAGDCAIFEMDAVLARGLRYQSSGQMVLADVDITGLNYARQAAPGFAASGLGEAAGNALKPAHYDVQSHFSRSMKPHPFFEDRPAFFEDAFAIQVAALQRRMKHIHTDKVLLAWSGGLDSTAALFAAHRAVLELGAPPSNVIAVSMPGLATSNRTRDNARSIAAILGSDFREIDISQMSLQQMRAIGHDGKTPDVVYENTQARLRMSIPLNLANMTGALQLSTGDMSEYALGWCTLGGDQTGMYGINAGIPKTMLQKLVRWHAFQPGNERLRDALMDVLDTPISPELTPGEGMQSTEDILGPYALHDFFLYHVLARGAAREKLLFLAERTFAGTYDAQTIQRTLDIFLRRFASSQFKRITAPESPAILGVSLNPFTGYVLPSDLSTEE